MGPEYKFDSLRLKSRASPNKVTNSGFGILMHGNPYSVGSRPVQTVLDFSFLLCCYILFSFCLDFCFICPASIQYFWQCIFLL